MEDRVIRLEEDMREVRSDQKAIRDLLTDIRLELAKKPNTGALWGMIATVIGVALAISAISFAVADWVARAT
jgi:hypothetical protein